MLAFSVTLTGRFICRANSYCANNDNNREVVLTVIKTITGRFICRVNSYCDNIQYKGVNM